MIPSNQLVYDRRAAKISVAALLALIAVDARAADPILNFIANGAQWFIIAAGTALLYFIVKYGLERAGAHGQHHDSDKLWNLCIGGVCILAAQGVLSLFKSWL
jgi:hypothetical protein